MRPNHSWDFVGDKPILVGPCPLTDWYLQPFLGRGWGGVGVENQKIYMKFIWNFLMGGGPSMTEVNV